MRHEADITARVPHNVQRMRRQGPPDRPAPSARVRPRLRGRPRAPHPVDDPACCRASACLHTRRSRTPATSFSAGPDAGDPGRSRCPGNAAAALSSKKSGSSAGQSRVFSSSPKFDAVAAPLIEDHAVTGTGRRVAPPMPSLASPGRSDEARRVGQPPARRQQQGRAARDQRRPGQTGRRPPAAAAVRARPWRGSCSSRRVSTVEAPCQ